MIGGLLLHNHAPSGYECPFCLLLRGIVNEHVYSVASDIVCQNEWTTALISSHQWPRNRGHVIVIPNQHYENIYDLPVHLGAEIYATAKAVALAMKQAYNCAGVSTRQHNEPPGNQDVWHYHLHVFPRYQNDELYQNQSNLMEAAERLIYARQLKNHLSSAVICPGE